MTSIQSETKHLPSQQVSTSSRAWAGGNSGLPIRLVNEDSSKVTDDVDDSEHESITRKHGQVRAFSVVLDSSAGINSLLEECFAVLVTIDGFALSQVVAHSLVQETIDGITGVDLDVHNENHCNQDSENDDSVDVTGQESSLETSRSSVKNHTPWDKERSQSVIHTGQSLNGGSSTQQKHGCHNNVGHEAEEQKGHMGSASPTSIDNFSNGVSRWRNLLEGNSQDTEKQNLNCGTGSIPETRN